MRLRFLSVSALCSFAVSVFGFSDVISLCSSASANVLTIFSRAFVVCVSPIISRIASSISGLGFLFWSVSFKRLYATAKKRIAASAWSCSFSVRPSGVVGFSPSVGTAFGGPSNGFSNMCLL